MYAVYVSDHNGWLDGCPDYEGVFFGRDYQGGEYVGPGDSTLGGHVEFASEADADAFLERLESSGDWRSHRSGEVERPSYAVAEIENEEVET